jgi:hypothetical protein
MSMTVSDADQYATCRRTARDDAPSRGGLLGDTHPALHRNLLEFESIILRYAIAQVPAMEVSISVLCCIVVTTIPESSIDDTALGIDDVVAAAGDEVALAYFAALVEHVPEFLALLPFSPGQGPGLGGGNGWGHVGSRLWLPVGLARISSS